MCVCMSHQLSSELCQYIDMSVYPSSAWQLYMYIVGLLHLLFIVVPIVCCLICIYRHFTYVYLAQVCLISPSCIESSWHRVIHDKLDVYLHTVSYEKIREEEIQESYEWLTVEPFVNLLYLPAVPQTEGLIGRVQLLSLQLVLFVLQNMLGRESQRELLLKEGLLDFITCCPQYVPPSLRPQAEELVQMVVSSPDIPEGPPKLLNIVKARLAKMHFGLEQVLSLSVSEIGTNFA